MNKASIAGVTLLVYCLTGAQELRSTEPVQGVAMTSADVMSAMSLDQLLDYIAVRLNTSEAAGEDFRMNLAINGTDDKMLQVKNSVLVYWSNRSSNQADVSVDMPRKTLEQLALDPSVPPEEVIVAGDSAVFERFIGMLDVFDPGFNIVLP